ncbi:FlaD/FlaE family flagellar protein [Natronorubrum halophilum]|uniref:FlaD/FlaE family flagellar protein n=1 Tax=Natronorubrum halophilum TaxID=1702106 RepID=UPI000EF65044|nr:FlaD/FlaE family flagellar protein [Natronorubrum halophilum]
MNFGLEHFRNVIEDFLTSSGGRRGREREQRREADDESLDDADAAAGEQSQGSETASDETDDESTESDSAKRSDSGGGIFSRGSDGDEDIDDLYYRIEELEAELESKSARLGSVRDSQEQVADQVEEVNETVRQLLGVYDMVTDDVNPFTGAGEERNGFGVFGEDEAGDESRTQGGFDLDATEQPSSGDETVSFDDLKGVIEDAAEAQSAGGRTITFDEDEEPDDTHVEVRATESVDQPADEPSDATASSDATDAAAADEDDVTLTALPNTYATDIIVFEWLTQLVRTAGSAATLRAISYYAEIGWIDERVKTHLEGVLSGPDLDIHVDPGTAPEELTAEDHADSYTYIMKIREIHETKREVEPKQSAGSGPGP